MKNRVRLVSTISIYILSAVWFIFLPRNTFYHNPALILISSVLGIAGILVESSSSTESLGVRRTLAVVGILLVIVSYIYYILEKSL
jgi:ABC-type spermidine/putrescine transport system permease subunit I